MKKRIPLIIIIIFAITIILYFRNIHTPSFPIKEAIYKSEISSENYIICKRARTTGFDWCVIVDENGNECYEFCNITGVNPILDLNLKYDFAVADNTYVFYVDETDEVFSEAINGSAKVYNAVDWDILYPVHHGTAFDFFETKKYIYDNDRVKE